MYKHKDTSNVPIIMRFRVKVAYAINEAGKMTKKTKLVKFNSASPVVVCAG